MSTKIDVGRIILGHISTLHNSSSNRIAAADLMTFFGFPTLLGVLAYFYHWVLNDKVLGSLISVGALLAALMLNLLVLITDRRAKTSELLKQTPGESILIKRMNALKELYCNISYVTLVSLALTALPLIALQFDLGALNFNTAAGSLILALTSLILAISAHLALTMLLVVKRTFLLLD